jgi:hypothetical protein
MALLTFLGGALLAFAATSVVAHRTRPQGLIASDGKGYYAWLRSLALDGDLDFSNDYALIYPPDPLPDTMERTRRGLVRNKYPPGVALVEAPGFVIGHGVALVSGAPANGVSAPYQFAVTLWLQLLCVAALGVLWLAAVRLGAHEWVAAILVASALSATNLVQYAARPAMAHAPGLAMLCFALYFAIRARQQGRGRDLVLTGALLGLAAIIRPSNVALAPLFLVLLFPPLRASGRAWFSIGAPFAIVIAIHVVLTSLLWGEPRISAYTDEGFTSGLRGIASTLFSSRHGLFVYHPWYLVLLAVAVIAAVRRGLRPLAIAALASFCLLAIVNGTWWSWWFGDSFGNRAFIELIPALVLVAATWLSALAGRRRVITTLTATMGVLSLANLLLWSGYVLRRFPPDGQHTVRQAWLWPWQ